MRVMRTEITWNIYKTADTKIDNRAQFWFNKDEDPDTVASVAYRNEIFQNKENPIWRFCKIR